MVYIKEKIFRKQRRWIQKLGHSPSYLFILSLVFFFFSPVKRFVMLPVKGFQKIFGIISFSVFRILWLKIWLVDDFIIHKKLRGSGVAQKLFERTEQELKNEGVHIMLLTSRKERKASHRFYKKLWMTIIGVSLGVIAYKRLKR